LAAHLRADAPGDGVEQGITDVAAEPAVQRRRAEEIREAVPIEPPGT
jgi:predicted phosphoribosyltransferase